MLAFTGAICFDVDQHTRKDRDRFCALHNNLDLLAATLERVDFGGSWLRC